MLTKIALGNMKRSYRDYAIYFLTIALGVAVFYAFNTIRCQADFLSASISSVILMVADLLTGVTVVLAFFLAFLMVYANNFIVRRRKKEFGLYRVLGMRTGQVVAIMAIETLLTSLVAFAAGIVLGVGISQLLVFVTAALFHDTVKNFTFIFSPEALLAVAVCFAVTFCVMLLLNLRSISKVRLVDLMSSGRKNESVRLRNLPLCSVMLVASVALIVWAYYRLLILGYPVEVFGGSLGGGKSNLDFLITTCMMLVGTFAFFWSLPTVLATLCQKTRALYLRGLNMFTIRQLVSRINSSSFAMAVTAVVLFLALTSVSTGMALAGGLTTYWGTSAPYTAALSATYLRDLYDEGSEHQVDKSTPIQPVDLAQVWESNNPDVASHSHYTQVNTYVVPKGEIEGDRYTVGDLFDDSPDTHAREAYAEFSTYSKDLEESLRSVPIFTIPVSQYNKLLALQGEPPVEVSEGGYLMYTCGSLDRLKAGIDRVLVADTPITLNGHTLRPANDQMQQGLMLSNGEGADPYLVVPDEVVANLSPSMSYLEIQANEGYESQVEEATDNLDFQAAVSQSEDVLFRDNTRTEIVESMNQMTAIIGYMAVYIGFVLVMSVAAVLAIQLLSGVADSTSRYRLLYDLGCPQRLLSGSLLSQTLFFFLLPLLMGIAHSLVALFSLMDLFALVLPFDMVSGLLFAGVVFLVVYGGYFAVSYGAARGAVSHALLGARRSQG